MKVVGKFAPGLHEEGADLRQGARQGALFLCDGLTAAHELEVGRSDIGDHPDMGPGDLAQEGNFSRVVHPHFQDAEFVVLPGFKHRQRQSDVVVQIPARRVHGEPLPQDRGREILRRGLAIRPRDPDDRNAQLIAIPAGQPLQGQERVPHLDHAAPARIETVRNPRHHQPGCPGLHRLRKEVVRVKVLPAERHKQGPGGNGTGVGRHPCGHQLRRITRHEFTAHRVTNRLYVERHHSLDFGFDSLRASSARRASRRSSKGTFPSANSW